MAKLRLWKYFLIPIAISIVTAAVIGVTAYTLSDTIGSFIARLWVWEWAKETVTNISSVIGGTLVVILGLILYKHIIMALSAPFMSPVSEKIEAHYFEGKQDYMHRKTSFRDQLWRGIRINLRNLAMELLLTIPLIILGFTPVSILATALIFLIQAYYAGFGNIDYTLERHLPYKESIAFVRNKRGIAIGNGIVFMLFLFIPILGIILVLPFSVTAASHQTISLLHKEKQLSSSKKTLI